MRTIILFIICIPFMALSQNKSLSYSESSSGLNYPDWDGGKSELEFADLNGDGHIDFVSVGDHGSPYINTGQHGIMVYFNDGTGSWSVQMNGDFGYGGIAIGDVNNDGLWDAGYGIHHDYSSTDLGDQILEVALGDGTGVNWSAWDDGLATNGEDWGMFGTDFADVDNDGDLDVGSVSFGCCAGVHVYTNQMDGTWQQSFGFIGGNSNSRFVFGDVNNDGNADFITAHQNGVVYFGDGTGNFTNATGNLPGPGSIGVNGPSLGDIDNDGDKDAAYIYNGLQIWGWDQVNETWIDLSGDLPTGSTYDATQLWDMNADGFTDLVAYGNGICTLWLGDGTGNWTQETQFTTTGMEDCQAFRVGGDIDQNGMADMVIMAEGGSWPSYQNYLKCYKETSPADSLWIRGLFPKGGEVFTSGSVQFIDWASEVPEGNETLVRLLFSSDGNTVNWDYIDDYLPNSGRYQWTVPNVYSNNCYIRLIVWSGDSLLKYHDAGPFTITGEPYVQANFTANPTLGPIPLEVQFTDMSTGPVTSWNWDFDADGNYDSQEQNPIWTYTIDTIYSVWLRVSNEFYSDSIFAFELIQTGLSAVANFTADPIQGEVPLEVQFTNLSQGGPAWLEWDFENDGIVDSNDENPVYIYDSAGIYSVKLHINNGISEDSLLKVDYIVVDTATGIRNVHEDEPSVYPNPADDFAEFRFRRKLDMSGGTVKIFDMIGKEIEKLDVSGDKAIWDCSNAPAGIYFYQWETVGKTFSGKLIISD